MAHVMSGGDQREDIFVHEADRHGLSKTLAKACQKAEWEVHAYCLKSNHFRTGIGGSSLNLCQISGAFFQGSVRHAKQRRQVQGI